MSQAEKYANDPNRVKVSVYMPESLKDELEAMASKELTTVAALLRRSAISLVAKDGPREARQQPA